MSKVNFYIAKTLFGLEDLLVSELQQVGAQSINKLNRAAEFKCTFEQLIKFHLTSRVALRVIKPIVGFEAENENEFYEEAFDMEWWRYFSVDQTFKIDATVYSDTFTHSQFIALKLKDAICDAFRKKYNKRPSIDVKNPDYIISLNIRKNEVLLGIDATGDSLHRRGYRLRGSMAPLNEVLAAGILELTEWNTDLPFVDGMTGSATVLIEAINKATNVPPNFYREHFAFMNWENFNKKQFLAIKENLREGILNEYPNITGVEIHSKTHSIAKDNLVRARLKPIHYLHHGDFFNYKPKEKTGVLFLNPPYDIRMKKDDIAAFYAEIGDHLKHHFNGWTAFIFTGNLEAAKHIGLRTSQRTKLFNGKLECRLLKFEMY